MKVLVTGASGFIGQTLCRALSEHDFAVCQVERRHNRIRGRDVVIVENIDDRTDWSHALVDVECVVHLAARVHVMHEAAADPLAEFRRVNVAGTLRLARAAAQTGVKRLLFLSSIKVNGEMTEDRPFSETDSPRPEDAYGISKWEAEQALHEVAREMGLEAVILRPPLVYGPRVKGNFLSLLRAVANGFPLPLGAIENQRSLLYVGNLADAIIECLTHPAAVGQTFLVSDSEPISTPQLIRQLAAAFGRPPRLLPIPPKWLGVAGRMLGKAGAIQRLTGSLVVDTSKIRSTLGWVPPYSMQQGLRETAAWYLARAHRDDIAHSNP